MVIKKDFDVTGLNTFGVVAKAKYYVEIQNEEDLAFLFETREFKENSHLFLGGGSNILFTKDFDGLLILNKLKGIEIIKEDDTYVWVRSMGGEVWHDLVLFAVRHNYWGIENLSFIPGTVGAAPMQNIGAYGVELKETLESVETYDMQTKEKKVFPGSECDFGYRDSIFKNKVKGRYFITAVVLKLSKKENKNVEYRALKEYFESNNLNPETISDISLAITTIRKTKLPDPKVLGNAGSFFKNIFIDEEELRELQQNYPDIPNFREGHDIKIPAAWLIEKCGWKGKRVGNVGMHEKQALVLVNYGGATGEEIRNFADTVVFSVQSKFGLTLVPEVNFV